MNKNAKTIILDAWRRQVPLCADRIAEQHDVVRVSAPDPSRTEHRAGLCDAPLYQSWEEVLATHGDAELAYVFVPHDVVREICLAPVARRLPLTVEKPAGCHCWSWSMSGGPQGSRTQQPPRCRKPADVLRHPVAC